MLTSVAGPLVPRENEMTDTSPRPLDPETGQFVEDMGLLYEDEGLPPMAGRLMGWLLICDPSHQTAAELAEVLGASGGSISQTTRLLIQLGFLDRIAIPGQRSAAFRLRPKACPEHMSQILQRTSVKRELLERALELLAGRPPEDAQRLNDHLGFLRFIERELPALIARWDKEGTTC